MGIRTTGSVNKMRATGARIPNIPDSDQLSVPAACTRPPAAARAAAAPPGNHAAAALRDEKGDLAGGVIAPAFVTLDGDVTFLDRSNRIKFMSTILAYIFIKWHFAPPNLRWFYFTRGKEFGQ